MFTPTSDLNSPDSILAYLARPLQAVHDALDDGFSYADTVIFQQQHDPHFWAHAARFRARRHLEGAQTSEWSLGRELPNSGIEIVRAPLMFRVLKAQSDAPPHPGLSAARRGFWSQAALPLIWNGIAFPSAANLIVDWDVGPRREVLLALSKPVGLWRFNELPQIEWRRHVIFDSNGHPRFQPADQDVDVQPKFGIDELDASNDETG